MPTNNTILQIFTWIQQEYKYFVIHTERIQAETEMQAWGCRTWCSCVAEHRVVSEELRAGLGAERAEALDSRTTSACMYNNNVIYTLI